MNEQQRIAESIFQQYGMDFSTAIRAGGWTNAVWLNGELALRVSFRKDSDRIRREVQLSGYLPDAIGYPVNIASGFMDGYEWSLSKRINGMNLSEVWNNLNWQERTDVIRQIVSIVELVHTVDISKIENLSNKHAWYSSFDKQETYLCLDKYRERGIFSAEQTDMLHGILERFWEKHNFAQHVLNHGDITMDNLLWSEGRVVSLMDFEHSVIAPSELDLHSLINLAFLPNEGDVLCDYISEEYRQNKNDVRALLKPLMDRYYSVDLILGYAILYRMRFLEFWLENPEGKLEELNAYTILLSFADGEGGYLAEIMQNKAQIS